MKTVIYTSLIGEYDNLCDVSNHNLINSIEFICFSNLSNVSSRGWKIVQIEDLFDTSYCNQPRTNRYYKLQPHIFLNNYDINVYLDSSIVISNIYLLLNYCQYLWKSKNDALFFKHKKRNLLRQEVRQVLESKKDQKQIVSKQYSYYLKRGFIDKFPLIEAGVQIRKTNSVQMINFLDVWWREVKDKSFRDQLSFPYALWKTGFRNYKLLSSKHDRKKILKVKKHLTSKVY